MSSDLKDKMGSAMQILKGRDYPAVGTVSKHQGCDAEYAWYVQGTATKTEWWK